jgi:hypothetical protein
MKPISQWEPVKMHPLGAAFITLLIIAMTSLATYDLSHPDAAIQNRLDVEIEWIEYCETLIAVEASIECSSIMEMKSVRDSFIVEQGLLEKFSRYYLGYVSKRMEAGR